MYSSDSSIYTAKGLCIDRYAPVTFWSTDAALFCPGSVSAPAWCRTASGRARCTSCRRARWRTSTGWRPRCSSRICWAIRTNRMCIALASRRAKWPTVWSPLPTCPQRLCWRKRFAAIHRRYSIARRVRRHWVVSFAFNRAIIKLTKLSCLATDSGVGDSLAETRQTYGTRTLSDNFHKFAEICMSRWANIFTIATRINKISWSRFPIERPSVSQLLNHNFFKQTRPTTLTEQLQVCGVEHLDCTKHKGILHK